MATARTSTRRSRGSRGGRTSRTSRTTVSRTTTRGGGGGGAARWVLPAAVVGGLALYLLWPRRVSATPLQPQPQIGPPPFVPPPASGVVTEPVADAQLPAGARRGRISGNDVNVRAGPGTNTAIVSRLNRGTGIAIVEAGPPSPGPGSQAGWWRVRTPRGINGYVAQELFTFEGGAQALLPGPGIQGAPFVATGFYGRY